MFADGGRGMARGSLAPRGMVRAMADLPTMLTEWLDGLSLDVPGIRAPIEKDGHAQALAHIVMEKAFSVSNKGIVISFPGILGATSEALATTVVLRADDRVLSMLNYATEADFIAAVEAPGFVHVDDLEIVNSAIRHSLAAIYDARLMRGTGTYRNTRIQGVTIQVTGIGPLRFTLFW